MCRADDVLAGLAAYGQRRGACCPRSGVYVYSFWGLGGAGSALFWMIGFAAIQSCYSSWKGFFEGQRLCNFWIISKCQEFEDILKFVYPAFKLKCMLSADQILVCCRCSCSRVELCPFHDHSWHWRWSCGKASFPAIFMFQDSLHCMFHGIESSIWDMMVLPGVWGQLLVIT